MTEEPFIYSIYSQIEAATTTSESIENEVNQTETITFEETTALQLNYSTTDEQNIDDRELTMETTVKTEIQVSQIQLQDVSSVRSIIDESTSAVTEQHFVSQQQQEEEEEKGEIIPTTATEELDNIVTTTTSSSSTLATMTTSKLAARESKALLEPHSQVVVASKNTRELVEIGVKNALSQDIMQSSNVVEPEMVIATTIAFIVLSIVTCMVVAGVLLRKRLRSMRRVVGSSSGGTSDAGSSNSDTHEPA